jgi:hypothetical protein
MPLLGEDSIVSDYLLALTIKAKGFTCATCGDYLGRFCAVAYDLENTIVCLVCYGEELGANSAQVATKAKLSVGCEVCGYAYEQEALQYDHINPTTKYRTKSGKVIHPSDLFRNCSLRVMNSELTKCQILCATHHAEKSARDRRLMRQV